MVGNQLLWCAETPFTDSDTEIMKVSVANAFFSSVFETHTNNIQKSCSESQFHWETETLRKLLSVRLSLCALNAFYTMENNLWIQLTTQLTTYLWLPLQQCITSRPVTGPLHFHELWKYLKGLVLFKKKKNLKVFYDFGFKCLRIPWQL